MHDRDTQILFGLLAYGVLAAFVLFGVVVVRRRDPSVHGLLLGSFGLGAVAAAGLGLVRRGGPFALDEHIVASLIVTQFVLVLCAIGWAFAVMVRPEPLRRRADPDPPVEAPLTAWALLHMAIVLAGIVVAGELLQAEELLLWWFPNGVHAVLAARDSPRIRRVWGAIASVALATTLVWYAAALLDANVPDDMHVIVPMLCAHHGLAMAQARSAAPAAALWPLVALALYRLVA